MRVPTTGQHGPLRVELGRSSRDRVNANERTDLLAKISSPSRRGHHSPGTCRPSGEVARWRGGRQHGTGRVRRALCLRERQPGDLRDPAHSRCPSRYQPRQLLPCERCPTPAAALLRPPRGTRPPPGAHERVAPAGSAGPGSSPSHVSAPSDTRSASSRTRSSPHPPGTFGSPECESPSQRCG